MTLTYQFGRFEVRPATRQLLVDSQPAALGARAFDLLLALIERRDRLVTKNELLELVWPGLIVEENNLQVQVSALRKLLGQDAIATVAGRGYRFTLEPAQTSLGATGRFVCCEAQPARAGLVVHRARARIRRPARDAGAAPAGDADRCRRDRQDPSGAGSRGRRGRRVCRRRLVRGSRAGFGSAPRCQCGRHEPRDPGRAGPAGHRNAASVRRGPGAAARARQLRASAARVRAAGTGPPAGRSAGQDRRDEPRAAPRVRRGDVSTGDAACARTRRANSRSMRCASMQRCGCFSIARSTSARTSR